MTEWIQIVEALSGPLAFVAVTWIVCQTFFRCLKLSTVNAARESKEKANEPPKADSQFRVGLGGWGSAAGATIPLNPIPAPDAQYSERIEYRSPSRNEPHPPSGRPLSSPDRQDSWPIGAELAVSGVRTNSEGQYLAMGDHLGPDGIAHEGAAIHSRDRCSPSRPGSSSG